MIWMISFSPSITHPTVSKDCNAKLADSLSKLDAHITHNAIWSQSNITGGSPSDYMQLPQQPKGLYTTFSQMQ